MNVFKKRIEGRPEMDPVVVTEQEVREVIKANFPDCDCDQQITGMTHKKGLGLVAVRGVQYFVEGNK